MMVSIPDWSRWGRLQGDPQSTSKPSADVLLARYDRNRELEAIRVAESSGYFLNVTPEVILVQHNQQLDGVEQPTKDVKKVKYLRFDNAHLRILGSIDFCVRLKILCLPNNFLSSIDGLSGLRHLIKLDLKGNQIQHLPGVVFWNALRSLRILHLHDNPIAKTESIQGLAGCNALSILTLHDTPLSLKKNYRHHIVNSIWSLRQLDFYVISDEEIIEDAKFPGPKFKVFDSNMKVTPYFTTKGTNYAAEMITAHRQLHQVSLIQTHNSPVLIIQRFIRGHLTRCRFRLAVDQRQWAASTVQNWWSKDGAAPTDKPAAEKPTEEGKAAEGTTAAAEGTVAAAEGTTAAAEGTSAGTTEGTTAAAEGTTALAEGKPAGTPEGKTGTTEGTIVVPQEGAPQPTAVTDPVPRPPSEARSEGASTVVKGPTSEKDLLPDNDPMKMLRGQVGSAAAKERQKTPITINLTQLDTGGQLPELDKEAAALETASPTFPNPVASVPLSARLLAAPKRPPAAPAAAQKASRSAGAAAPGQRRIRDIKQFFGPVVPVMPATEEELLTENDSEVPMVAFRLRGLPPVVADLDAVTEMIIGRVEAAKRIRDAETEFHRQRLMEPSPRVERHAFRNTDQRLFGRIQGTMGTLLMQKWDRIDRDVRSQERQAAIMEKVMAARDAHLRSKENLRLWKEEKRSKARQARQKDWRDNNRQIDRRRLAVAHENERCQWHREREKQMRQTFDESAKFAQDFTTQHTSVSKALMRHDRQAFTEDRLQGRSEMINAQRDADKEQLETVRKYLEHQRLLRQAEIAVERAALNSKLLAETNDRLLNAHARVDRLKALHRHAVQFTSAPQNYPEAAGADGKDLRGASRFEVQAAMYAGRVGMHPST